MQNSDLDEVQRVRCLATIRLAYAGDIVNKVGSSWVPIPLDWDSIPSRRQGDSKAWSGVH
jgi:hypothetical protein